MKTSIEELLIDEKQNALMGYDSHLYNLAFKSCNYECLSKKDRDNLKSFLKRRTIFDDDGYEDRPLIESLCNTICLQHNDLYYRLLAAKELSELCCGFFGTKEALESVDYDCKCFIEKYIRKEGIEKVEKIIDELKLTHEFMEEYATLCKKYNKRPSDIIVFNYLEKFGV